MTITETVTLWMQIYQNYSPPWMPLGMPVLKCHLRSWLALLSKSLHTIKCIQFQYTVWWALVNLYSYRIFLPPPKFPSCPFLVNPYTSIASPRQQLLFCVSIVLPFLQISSEIQQRVVLCVWLLSFSMFLKSIFVVVSISRVFCWIVLYCMETPHFVHPFNNKGDTNYLV